MYPPSNPLEREGSATTMANERDIAFDDFPDPSICSSSSATTSTACFSSCSRGPYSVGPCSSQAVCRHQQGAERHQRSSGEIRRDEYRADCNGPPQSYQEGAAVQRQASRSPRISDSPQGVLAEAPQGSYCLLGRTNPILYAADRELQDHDGADSFGASSRKTRYPTAQPHGGRYFECPSTGDCGSDRDRGGHHRRRWQQAVDGSDEQCLAEVCTHLQCRRQGDSACCDRRRGGRGTNNKETPLCRARCRRTWRWGLWITCLVSLGDRRLGPFEIINHAPIPTIASWEAFAAEAYVPTLSGCAARSTATWKFYDPSQHALHSVRLEKDFKDIFNALHNASKLRRQSLDDVCDCVPFPSNQIMFCTF